MDHSQEKDRKECWKLEQLREPRDTHLTMGPWMPSLCIACVISSPNVGANLVSIIFVTLPEILPFEESFFFFIEFISEEIRDS